LKTTTNQEIAMATEQEMKTAMQAYIDRYNSGDPEAVIDLFADTATVEDPIGSEPHKGKQAIAEFYRYAVGTGAKLKLDAPIRATQANAAAMAFSVEVDYQGAPCRIHVIDVMTFDAAGKFASMRAYWGPGDVEVR